MSYLTNKCIHDTGGNAGTFEDLGIDGIILK
jgi:hypothetical protein